MGVSAWFSSTVDWKDGNSSQWLAGWRSKWFTPSLCELFIIILHSLCAIQLLPATNTNLIYGTSYSPCSKWGTLALSVSWKTALRCISMQNEWGRSPAPTSPQNNMRQCN